MAEAGVMMPKLAGELAKRGAAGFEWAVGVPGSIGGAVVQNAGAWGEETKDRLMSVEYVTPGEDQVRTMTVDALNYRYRGSAILDAPPEERPIVLRAWFRLDKDDPAEIAARNAQNIAKRTASQPRAATGGSTFQNPPSDHAGRLVEAAGLKGYRLGNASISDQHANFIINHGGATANEIRGLIELARLMVREKFGVELHPEIEFVGYWKTEGGAESKSE
jgi:UDP-N-acetylmuramate dehydrogenase